MQGDWKVQSSLIGNKTIHIACRVKDTSKVIHSGSMQIYGIYYGDRAVAQSVVDGLNQKEKEPTPSADEISSSDK